MIKHYFLLGSNCRCKNLTNHNNVGNCRGTKPSQFGRKFVACYVVQPSSCIDLRDSGTNHGEQLSADACAKNGKRIFDSLKYILKRTCINFDVSKFCFSFFSRSTRSDSKQFTGTKG